MKSLTTSHETRLREILRKEIKKVILAEFTFGAPKTFTPPIPTDIALVDKFLAKFKLSPEQLIAYKIYTFGDAVKKTPASKDGYEALKSIKKGITPKVKWDSSKKVYGPAVGSTSGVNPSVMALEGKNKTKSKIKESGKIQEKAKMKMKSKSKMK